MTEVLIAACLHAWETHACLQGFVLKPNDVSDIMSAVQDILDGQIYADASATPDQNLNTLVRTIRLLQVGLDLQLTENEDLSSDFNRMQDEFAVRWTKAHPLLLDKHTAFPFPMWQRPPSYACQHLMHVLRPCMQFATPFKCEE